MDWFTIIFLLIVLIAGYWSIAEAAKAINTGVATYSFRYHFHRDEKPYAFWFITIGRTVSFLACLAIIIAWLHFVGVALP
jgi:glycerol-3-phosphate acyltransferase PlsY